MSVKVVLTANIKKFREAMKKAQAAVGRAAKGMKRSFQAVGKAFKKLSGILKTSLIPIIIATGAAFLKMIKDASKMETIITKFKVLTGNVKIAKKHVAELTKFSAQTPFQLEQIAESSAVLQAFGENVTDVRGKLRQIGDVAAATGQPLKQIAVIYGQVGAAGKLTGERLLQLQERGVPILAALAKKFNVTGGEVRELITQGKVTTKIFNEAFATMSKKGGFAFKGMIEQSKTLAGKWSTMKDNIAIASIKIGEFFLPIAKKVIDNVTTIAKGLTTMIDKFQRTTKALPETKGFWDTITSKSLAFAHALGIINIKSAEFTRRLRKIREEEEAKDKLTPEEQAEADAKATELKYQKELGALRAYNESKYEEDFNRLEEEKLLQDMDQKIKLASDKKRLKDVEKFQAQKAKIEKKMKKDEINRDLQHTGQLMAMQNSKHGALKAAGKAFALWNIKLQTQKSMMSSFDWGSKLGGPILGGVFAALALAYGLERFREAANLYDGGTVLQRAGGSPYRDSVPANVAVGETVISRRLTEKLDKMSSGQQVQSIDNRLTVNIQGNVVADNDTQVDELIERISESVTTRGTRLVASAMEK